MKSEAETQAAPLSFSQERLWFLNELEGPSATYNVLHAFSVQGPLNRSCLQQAFAALIERHEMLRTTFRTKNGKPLQVVHRSLSWKPRSVDLCGLSQSQQEEERQRVLTQEAAQPFDFTQGPLWRASLISLVDNHFWLLVTLHHIITDGWSTGVLFHELQQHYEASLYQHPARVSALPVQYADFASWQHQWLQGKRLNRLLSYWQKQLAGCPPVLALPTDHPRPAVQRFQGAAYSFELDTDRIQAIETLGRQEGCTLFMTLLTVFNILLHRISRQDSILVGTPTANRQRREIEPLIGCFVNTLVLRTQFSGNPEFSELLRQVRQTCLGAYEHQDLPFEKLVEVLQPERSLSHSPLFQVFFVLQHTPKNPLQLPNVTVQRIDTTPSVSLFDLTLTLTETKSGLQGTWTYDTDLFDSTTVERLAQHFDILLESITQNPQGRVMEFPLLSPKARHQILVDWNQTQADFSQELCVHHLFEAQAARTPHAVAVTFESHTISYQALNTRANQLAAYLQKKGAGPDGLVGLCVERSIEMVVGLLGILKAGAAYVPFDPTNPPERLAFMSTDAGIRLLVTQQALTECFPDFPHPRADLDTDWELIAQEPPTPAQEPPTSVQSKVTPDHLAYTIYTSGSTGRPKGVLIEHRSLVNLIEYLIRTFEMKSEEHVLQFASLGFDVATSYILMSLCSGATLHLASRESLFSVEGLLHILREQKISYVQLPPSVLRMLPVEALPHLKILSVGGEECPAEIMETWSKGRRFFNIYGPTEATVNATMWEYVNTGQRPPIGRPMSNTQIYLLDPMGQPVPIGVPGELHIGGVGLARGYHNRPDLTQAKFIPNPFAPESSARLYKTGDLAKYRPDGTIEFLGRLDHQVKLRGFRIELGEVETVLNHHPRLRESVVIVRQVDPHEKQMVAYLVPHAEAPSTAELRAFLEKQLPHYMIPNRFVFLEKLPLNSNGKLDRLALPAPPQENTHHETDFIHPRDTVELQLAQIWSEVLKIYPLSIRDNFFERGGHSLSAVQMVAQVQKHFDQTVPLAAVFQAPTVEQFAARLRQGFHTPSIVVPLQPEGTRSPFFCVHPVGGHVFCYADLAHHLADHLPSEPASRCPVYGLQSPLLHQEQDRPKSLIELAIHYIQAIRSVRPTGPYSLGGWSFGGTVAYEMARQLVAGGEVVDCLVLMDSFPFTTVEGSHPLDLDAAELALRFVQDLHAVSQRHSLVSVETLRQLPTEKHLPFLFEHAQHEQLLPPDIGMRYWERLFQVFRSHWQLARHYEPSAYSGRTILFAAQDKHRKLSQDPSYGWKPYLRDNLEIHEVSGTHYSILHPPQVQEITDLLQRIL